MFVRMTTIHGDKGKIDAAVEFVEESGRPALESAAGSRGVATFVDREAGVTTVASYWDDADAMRASEKALADRRGEAGEVAGGDVTVASYEVAIGKRVTMPAAGATVRMLRAEADPAQVDDMIAFYRETALPEIASLDRLCSVQLLVDRDSGKAISATVWEDEAAVSDAQGALEGIVAKFTERFGDRVTAIESHTLIGTTVQLP